MMKTVDRLLWTGALFALMGFSAHAQQDPWQRFVSDPNYGSHRFLQFKLHTGGHLYSGEDLEEVLEQGYVATELRYGWQTNGSQAWQRAYNMPLYGIGLYSGYIGDATILGQPSGIYGFFHHPLWRRPRHHFDWELAVGVTYDLQPYDPETNPLNDAIGSKLAVYFNVEVGGNWKLNDALDLTYGLDLSHFSNGRSNVPNYGLNMMGLNVGLRYHYNDVQRYVNTIQPGLKAPVRPIDPRLALPPADRTRDISGYVALGGVEYEQADGEGAHYLAGTAYVEYAHRFSHRGGWTAGVDWFYDGSLEGDLLARGDSSSTAVEHMYGGVHVGATLYVGRLQVEGQLGTYWYQPLDHNGEFWMRVAGRYNFTDRIFGQVGLKTRDGAAADWIEWGIGYRLKRWRAADRDQG